MQKSDKIFIAGHNGLAGSAIHRLLKTRGFSRLIMRTRSELDLTQQQAVFDFFKTEKPDYVFLAAAKVGGIQANNIYRADFIYENLMIECNVIRAAFESHCKRLLFLGSSCIYPRDCPQPMKESALLTGPLEATNEPYAIAKIAGLKLCESFNRQYDTHFVSVMPTNLYGPQDNFSLENAHVLPALLRKFHEAKIQNQKQVTIWGTGTPQREFLFVDDMAEACVFVMEQKNEIGVINIGSGQEVSIRALAEMIADVTGFQGTLHFDTQKPDGTPRKLLDTRYLDTLGWHAHTSLKEGLQKTYAWFIEQEHQIRKK